MFNKPARAAANGRAAGQGAFDGAGARRSPKVPSMLTDDLTIDGAVSGDGELQVDGAIRGDVSVQRLSVGEAGRIEGAITAELVEVRGRVAGSITAKHIRLYATAHVDGDLTHESLTIESGAHFEGRSQGFHRPPPALAVAAPVEAQV